MHVTGPCRHHFIKCQLISGLVLLTGVLCMYMVLSHVIVSEDGSCPRCDPDDNETAGRDYLGHPDGGRLSL